MSLRVLHIITGLNPGGAEGMLLKLVTTHQSMGITSHVVSLSGSGVIGHQISALGIGVEALNSKRPAAAALAAPRLLALVKSFRPSVIQTWLPHADLVGGLLGAVVRRVPVVWNIRMTAIPLERKVTRFLAQTVNRRLSFRLPRGIICCAQEALDHYAGLGYARAKMAVIPNGFDLDEFQPNAAARLRIRGTLAVHPDDLLVGIVGRLHPMKDHRTFIAAAGIVRQRVPNVKFLLAGTDLDDSNRELWDWLRAAGVADATRCVGRRDDVPELYSALDLNVLSSISEGFPNVLGEAMACGVPCVATDVGASKAIIGDTGIVVAPSDPPALANAIVTVLAQSSAERQRLGGLARARIEHSYSLAAVAREYAVFYERLLKSAS